MDLWDSMILTRRVIRSIFYGEGETPMSDQFENPMIEGKPVPADEFLDTQPTTKEAIFQEEFPDLTLDQILRANDRPYERILVPEWGGWITVRGLTAGERDRFEASMLEGKGKNQKTNPIGARAKLLILSIVDPKTKQPMFTAQHIRQLSDKASAATERLIDLARKLSGITEEEMDEIEGNSETGQSDASF